MWSDITFLLCGATVILTIIAIAKAYEYRIEKDAVLASARKKKTSTEFTDTLVDGMSKLGFEVVSRTETQVQVKRRKQFSFIFAMLWFLFFGVGIIIYLCYYAAKRDEVLTFTFQAPEAAA